VDFRLPGEVLVNGKDRLPPGVTLVSLPVPGADIGTFYDLIASGDHPRQQEVLGHGRAAEFMVGLHRGFVADQRQRDGFGIALRMMADPAQGLPLLYHCTSGKERTGWLTAMMRDPGLLRPILELNPAYLEAAFDEIGHRYGTFNEFMYRGLGMDEQTVAGLLGALLA
jgi:protein-tyrosine phosphatase